MSFLAGRCTPIHGWSYKFVVRVTRLEFRLRDPRCKSTDHFEKALLPWSGAFSFTMKSLRGKPRGIMFLEFNLYYHSKLRGIKPRRD